MLTLNAMTKPESIQENKELQEKLISYKKQIEQEAIASNNQLND